MCLLLRPVVPAGGEEHDLRTGDGCCARHLGKAQVVADAEPQSGKGCGNWQAERLSCGHAVGLAHLVGIVEVALAIARLHVPRIVDNHSRVERWAACWIDLAHGEDHPETVLSRERSHVRHEGTLHRLGEPSQLLCLQRSGAHEVLGEDKQLHASLLCRRGDRACLCAHIAVGGVADLCHAQQKRHGSLPSWRAYVVYSAQKTRPSLRATSLAGVSA